MKPFKKYQLILFGILILASLLRFFWLDRFPNSLYSDEINQGYNAYSVLKTLKDEHGTFLPLSFRSFGDWKPPLQTYVMIPFIAIFGLNEFSLRLPSALLGVASIAVGYLLVIELFRENRLKRTYAILSALFLAISPWHILQSRSAMLVMVALFLLELGVYFFLKALRSSKFYVLSSVSLVLSVYAYYGMRIITPLIFFILIFLYQSQLRRDFKKLVIPLFIGILILLPLLIAFFKQPDVLFGRAKTVSVFYDQGIKLRQWELITQDGLQDPKLSLFFHNSYVMYGRDILRRFFSHFDGNFLTLTGDQVMPFFIPSMGVIYISDFFLIALGSIVLLRRTDKNASLLIFWIIVALIPAAFTFLTPTSNRTFNMVFPLCLLASVGIVFLKRKMQKGYVLMILFLVAVYAGQSWYFLRQYFQVLPLHHAYVWNYGFKDLALYLSSVEKKFETIYISDKDGMPYVYLLFFQNIDPIHFQRDAIRTYTANQFGFEHVEQFGKYVFVSDFDWKYIRDNAQPKSLYVVPASQTDSHEDGIKTIYYPDGKPAYKLFSYE